MIASRNMLIAVGVLLVAGLAVAVFQTGYAAWTAALLVLVGLAGWDLWVVRRRPAPRLKRQVDNSLPLGVVSEIQLEVTFADGRGGRVELYDGVPVELGANDPRVDAKVQRDQLLEATYTIEPHQRGRFEIEEAYLRQYGPLGLMARQIRIGQPQKVRVVPNFRAVSRYALLAVADKTSAIGVRRLRRRGEGMEFDCLREYREGDQLRQIDWKATARHRRLIARQYEDERHQQVMLVFDCGRRMRAIDGELSHFDHALNAGLLLSYVALQQGDSVTVSTFGGVDRWVARQRGPRAVEAIVDRTFDLQTTTQPSDFSGVAERVAVRQKRRALVVLLTNLYDAEPDELDRALALLNERHLVLIASLREEGVQRMADGPIRDLNDALQVGATHHFLNHRRKVHARLRRAGAMVLDVTPSELSVQLVNRYLEIKRSGEL